MTQVSSFRATRKATRRNKWINRQCKGVTRKRCVSLGPVHKGSKDYITLLLYVYIYVYIYIYIYIYMYIFLFSPFYSEVYIYTSLSQSCIETLHERRSGNEV